jgi:hypothetical protein
VQFDELLHQGQAEAKAAVCACRRVVGLAEPLEHMGQELGDDAPSRVAHGNLDRLSDASRGDFHATTRRGELDGVREQVPDHLLQARGVAHDLAFDRLEDACDRDALRLGGGVHRLERHLDHHAQLDSLHPQAQLARQDPAHVEQVGDELHLHVGVAVDHRKPLLERRR